MNSLTQIQPESLAQLQSILTVQPFPFLFVTVSGAHLYGFASPDSDFDIRGTHILPLTEALRLEPKNETLELSTVYPNGLELDLVTHDIRKFFGMMLKRNGYVLEQLFSPLILRTTSEHEELKLIARQCLTRHHSHHYLGFAATQWKLFEKENPLRVKPLLYVYRVLLTGIHLMEMGEVEAHLLKLNEIYRLPYLAELIACKQAGPEKGTLPETDVEFHRREFNRLVQTLEAAQQSSHLPERPGPSAQAALDDLLVRVRLQSQV